MEFSVKPVKFLGRSCVVICQNENGPCPLLAIANILLLQDKISISSDISIISLAELTQIVANAILEKIGQSSLPEHVKLVESVLNILPKLANGLDLNVIFSGVNKFEFTEEISVFDALGIQLLHGWICDPSNAETTALIGNLSYNHLIFRLVEYKSLSLEKKDAGTHDGERSAEAVGENGPSFNNATEVDTPKDVHLLRQEGALIEKFLADTAGQFTYAGMLALYSTMQDRQFAVFFRNNHFSTMFFYNGQLFTLITDLGYLHEPSVVWELLDHIDGNSEFYNERFESLASTQSPGFVERHLQEFAALASTTASDNSPNSPASATNGGTIAAPPMNRKLSGVPTICAPPSVSVGEKKVAVKAEKMGEEDVESDVPDLPLPPAVVPSASAEDTSGGVVDASLLASGVLVSNADAPGVIEGCNEATAGRIDDSYELVDHHQESETVETNPTGTVTVTTTGAAVGAEAGDGAVAHIAAPSNEPALPETEPVESNATVLEGTITPPLSSHTAPDDSESKHEHEPPRAGAENTASTDDVVHVHSQSAAVEPSIDADLLFAMQLQAEEDRLAAQHEVHNLARQNTATTTSAYPGHNHTNTHAQGSLLSQEESDREHALRLHYEELQAEQQRGAQNTTSSTGLTPPTRYTTYAASGSGSFPYNRQQERPAGQGRAKDKNCVIS